MINVGRRRAANNLNLPVGLYSKKLNGVTRYYYRDHSGKEVYYPEQYPLPEIIEAVVRYNDKHRTSIAAIMDKKDKFNRRVEEVWPDIKKVMLKEKTDKGVAQGSIDTFMNDCTRFIEFFAKKFTKQITLEQVNEFLDTYHKDASNNVRNRKTSFLQSVFAEFVDKSFMASNPALLKKFRPKAEKVRERLEVTEFEKILKAAPSFLQIAMRLSLQTTHAVNEVSVAKYEDCHWFTEPMLFNELTGAYEVPKGKFEHESLIYGMLRISRYKNRGKDASNVEIPITYEIKSIIDDSKIDGVESPYIVHVAKQKTNKKRGKGGKWETVIPKGCDHITQLTPSYISKEFSSVREALGLFPNLPNAAKPSFHEIRALSISILEFANNSFEVSDDTSARAAHSDKKITKKYTTGREKWNRVKPAVVKLH